MRIKKHIPSQIWHKLRLIKAMADRIAIRLFWSIPIDDSKIVFSNFSVKGYGDNPKYIAEELRSYNSYKLLWVTKDMDGSFPEGIKPIRYGSLSALYHIATSGMWINNVRTGPNVVKRKGQFYIQTWHGSMALKKIEKDAEEKLDTFYIKNAKRDSQMIDLMISDSSFSDHLYRSSFWYTGEVKRLGTPRLDALFDLSDCEDIRNKLGITAGNYVVMYAPTFRNNLDITVYDIDLESIKMTFEKATKKEVIILVRMHPNIPTDTVCFKEGLVQDVSTYPDVYELMKISDVLITDYSSTMFEFPVADPKPVFCYAKDRDDYDRGFYFELDELPFLFARSNKELIDGITSFNLKEYKQDLEAFYKSIGLHADGEASKHVADYILQIKA